MLVGWPISKSTPLSASSTRPGGNALWAQLSEDRPPVLLGRPALEAEEFDSSITALEDNFILLFGDFSSYVVADRLGTTVELIPMLFNQAVAGAGFGMPTGQRGWYAHYRVGAGIDHSGAFRMLAV